MLSEPATKTSRSRDLEDGGPTIPLPAAEFAAPSLSVSYDCSIHGHVRQSSVESGRACPFAATVRHNLRQTDVIVPSMHADESYIMRGRAAGAAPSS